MKTFSGVTFLISAQFLALSAFLAVSVFSIAAHSSERHASLIAGERICAIDAASFCAACPNAYRSHACLSQSPAEVC